MVSPFLPGGFLSSFVVPDEIAVPGRMTDGTACVVAAGAQSAREPARILLHGLAHADGGVSSPRRADDRASRPWFRATSTLAPTIAAVRAAILGPACPCVASS